MAKDLEILVINDTRNADSNPGCKATMTSLLDEVKHHWPNANITTLPLGHGKHHFFDLAGEQKPPSIFEKISNKFKKKASFSSEHYDVQLPPIDQTKWEQACSNFVKTETSVIKEIMKCDIIIANMEGSIHHNSPYGLSIICIGKIAKSHNKKVIFTNGSIHKMDIQLLQKEFSKFDYISVREPLSFEFLSTNRIKVNQGADYAFLSEKHRKTTDYKVDSNSILLTFGVLCTNKQLPGYLDEKKIQTFLSNFNISNSKLYYLVLEEKEKQVIDQLDKHNITIIDFSDHEWPVIFDLLSQFSLVITGRYHIGIFSAMAEVPFILLDSNTWKMEGLCSLLNYSANKTKVENFSSAMLNNLAPVDLKFVQQCQNLAKNNLPKW